MRFAELKNRYNSMFKAVIDLASVPRRRVDIRRLAALVCVASHLFCAGMGFYQLQQLFMTCKVQTCDDIVSMYMRFYHPQQYRIMGLSYNNIPRALTLWEAARHFCGESWQGCRKKAHKPSKAEKQKTYRERTIGHHFRHILPSTGCGCSS